MMLIPVFAFGNDKKIPTKIKEVTVYLNGAQITRTATFQLRTGTNEYIFNGLSPKMDESSIQISGLQSVSLVSMAYNIDYLSALEVNPEVLALNLELKAIDQNIYLLKNLIFGLEEEQKIIQTNRLISGESQDLDLIKLKEISAYYRERTTELKAKFLD